MIRQFGTEVFKRHDIKSQAYTLAVADRHLKRLGGSDISFPSPASSGERIAEFRYRHSSKLERLVEWARCLTSPTYAERTWLRITPEQEQTLARRFKQVLAILLIANVIVLCVGYVRFQHALDRSRESLQQLQIEQA